MCDGVKAKCVVCGQIAVIQWLMIDGKPAFCKKHLSLKHTEPYGVWPSGQDNRKVSKHK